REKIAKELLDQYGTKDIDPKVLDEIQDMSEAMEKMPTGRVKNKQAIDILSKIENESGIKKTDLMFSLWYAGLLSGTSTQALNIMSNSLNLLGETFTTVVQETLVNKDPKNAMKAMTKLFSGWEEALKQGADILKHGGDPDKISVKLEAKNVLESVKFKGVLKPLNTYKYVSRFMVAMDSIFYYKFRDMRYHQLAGQMAKDEGLKGEELNNRVTEILYNSKEDIDGANKQAQKELDKVTELTGKEFSKTDVSLRGFEILDQNRAKDNPEIVTDADKFAAHGTFNYDPEGILGVFSNVLTSLTTKVPPVKFIIPFTRIVANVLNQQLDYTPYGFVRAQGGISRMVNKVFSNANITESAPQTAEARSRQLIKAAWGTMMMAGLYSLAKAYDEDEDPYFAITGKGPRDFNKKSQLFSQGWKPYSIKIGDLYIPYQFSPAGYGLAVMGNTLDAEKYDDLTKKDLSTRTAFALSASTKSIFDMSFLTGLGGVFKALSSDSDPEKEMKNLLKPVSSLPSTIVPSLIRQVDKMFDPTIYEAREITEAVVKNIPFARQTLLKPALNAYGQPVEKTGTRFSSTRTEDPVWKLMAERELFAPKA
ncbi:MAG: hypothetical protein KAS32_14875, partial [Candidatus Peribacteraceae bacterium]|nr:hypothetical protein [Candidatus Peribacteraceae bacterium]